MSIPTSYLMDDAAIAIGDPRKKRVTPAEWTSFYNRAARELAQKANVMQYRAKFNPGAQQVYHYPDEMRVMTKMEVSETPDNDDTWGEVKEMFEDEFRATTSGYYPSSNLPSHYFADSLGFYLIPRPTVTIVNGGRITYFGLPDRITDIQTATFELLEIAQDHVLKRMIVFGLKARNRHVEADSELQQWFVDIEGLHDAMGDRSDDRRSSLRPRRDRFAGHR